MHKKLLDKLPYLLSLVFVFVFLFWAVGCQPVTRSLVDPARKVNRAELIGEIDYLMSKYKIAIKDLDKQKEFRELIINQSTEIFTSGGINPAGLTITAMSILGLGAGADNVRLRRKRKHDHQNEDSDRPNQLRSDSSSSE